MKKILLFFICCAVIGLVNAQLPFINYQGVARNAAGQPLASQTIGVKTTIVSDYPVANTIHYIEIRPVTTNQFGLFSFQIGNPTGASVIPLGAPNVPAGAEYFFIPWEKLTNTKLVTSISTNGGTSYTDLGTSTLANVPFANVANYAKAAAPWTTATFSNTITPDLAGWKLGLGTNSATEKLHVVGKIRIEDGNQGVDKLMTSDASGVATWKAPLWTKVPFGLPSNNFSTIYLTDSTRTSVGIGTTNPQASLHVLGRLKLEIGNEGTGKVLTSDANGFALWRNLDDITGALWKKQDAGVTGHPGQFITRSVDSSTFLLIKDPTQISPRASTFQGNNWQDPQSYALNVRSPNSYGVAIGVQGIANNDKKFITFFDGSATGQNIKGRIEGETADELVTTQEYILFSFIQTSGLAEYAAEAIAAGFNVPPDVAEVIVNGAAATAYSIEWAVQVQQWKDNAGVSYQSGSGDYAEWLEKNDPSEKFSFGDIVEVNGGKISKRITGKGQLMVISHAPIVLGNMPEPGKEKFSEKVAFMGQVPVKVTGDVATGDYIISSGENTGLGYAVHPKNITPDEYKRMVGVAWSASSGKTFSLINTAVGLNTNSVVNMVTKLEEEVHLLKTQINEFAGYLHAKDTTFKYVKLNTDTPLLSAGVPGKSVINSTTTYNTLETRKTNMSADFLKYASTVTSEKIKKILKEHPEAFSTTWKYLKNSIEEQAKKRNISFDNNPQMKLLLSSESYFVQQIKEHYNITD